VAGCALFSNQYVSLHLYSFDVYELVLIVSYDVYVSLHLRNLKMIHLSYFYCLSWKRMMKRKRKMSSFQMKSCSKDGLSFSS
jgi:hypothetical protein